MQSIIEITWKYHATRRREIASQAVTEFTAYGVPRLKWDNHHEVAYAEMRDGSGLWLLHGMS